jgi:futalosine hydrolase
MLYASNDLLKAAGDKWPVVKGVTVSTSSGTLDSIQRLTAKFEPEIETMEVAAFYYTCTMVGIPSIAIRSISNMVLPGDRSTWNIGLAIRELGPAVSDLIDRIAKS